MKPKNEKINFNTEHEFDFYTKRFSTSIGSYEKLKGLQLQNYQQSSVLYNPQDMDYTIEELEEKLNKAKYIVSLLEKDINTKENEG